MINKWGGGFAVDNSIRMNEKWTDIFGAHQYLINSYLRGKKSNKKLNVTSKFENYPTYDIILAL